MKKMVFLSGGREKTQLEWIQGTCRQYNIGQSKTQQDMATRGRKGKDRKGKDQVGKETRRQDRKIRKGEMKAGKGRK